jgi:probable selenium-dependent hydroxylase accessory protein YqeC
LAGNTQVDAFTVEQTASLLVAFDLHAGEVISLVGGGGKTSLMFALALTLSASGNKVISTTTTRIMPPAPEQSSCVIIESGEDLLMSKAISELEKHKHITLARLHSDEGKLRGIYPETVDRLAKRKWAGYIINEADGSAGKPIKAPNTTEPVIPSSTSLVIAVAGMDALGSRLSQDTAFRPEIISRLTGLSMGDVISEATIATLLTHPDGIIQYSPPGAMIIPYINKMDLTNPQQGISLAQAILKRQHPQIERVVLGSLRKSGQLFTMVCYN